MKPQQPGVYFIQAERGEIKIGYSSRPYDRLRALQTNTISELRMLKVIEGAQSLEKELHERFKQHRVRGEWFNPHKELLAFIGVATIHPALAKPAISINGHTPKQQPRKISDDLKPAQFGGCIICDRYVKPPGNMCNGCAGSLAYMFRDPQFPENHPEELWKALHGHKDMWDQILGPEHWPYAESLIAWIEHQMLATWPSKGLERGAMFSRSMPAQIRLAGPFVLRKATEAGKFQVLKHVSGTGGFWFRATR
jgi:hypothetical protein